MDDQEIIRLYYARNEDAITQTTMKYGAYCRSIATNILHCKQDVEECLNDTWHRTWNSIPPQRPNNLRVWLGRVIRNLALNYRARNHAQKRDSTLNILFSELEDCIPRPDTAMQKLEEQELTAFLNQWLSSLPRQDRVLFLRRYWKGDPLKTLEQEYGFSHGKMAKRMYTLRAKLRQALEKEGYTL